MWWYYTREPQEPLSVRAWWHITKNIEISIEGSVIPRRYPWMCHAEVRRGNRSLNFSLAIPLLFQVWLKFGGILPWGSPRSFSINFHNWCLWLTLGKDPSEGYSYCLHFDHLIFGRAQYSKEDIETREILVPMPERSYVGKGTLYRASWKYPRWFTNSILRVEIEVPEGVPFEGKGENSYDCGVDRCYSMTTMARSIPEGIGNFVGSVLRDRVKNGGWSDYVWHKEAVA